MDPLPPSDDALLAAARAGDTGAFEALCARYRALLVSRVRRWLGAALQRRVSIQDVLQEAYVVALGRLDRFEPEGEGAFGAWVAQIAEFKAREAVRRHAQTRKRAGRREVSVAPAVREAAPARDPSPSQVVAADERAAAARAALEALPDDYRHVLTLVQVNHLSLSDAAALLGRSYEATKKLYGRALSRYAEVLAVERRPRGAPPAVP